MAFGGRELNGRGINGCLLHLASVFSSEWTKSRQCCFLCVCVYSKPHLKLACHLPQPHLLFFLFFCSLTCFADGIVAARPRTRTTTMAVAVVVVVAVVVAKVESLVLAGGGEVVLLGGGVRRPGKVGALRARGPRGPRGEVGRREMGTVG